jgi:hypothetical protein
VAYNNITLNYPYGYIIRGDGYIGEPLYSLLTPAGSKVHKCRTDYMRGWEGKRQP